MSLASAQSRTVSCGTFNPENPYNCTITITDHGNGTEDVRIDRPYVNGPFWEYRSIVFKPNDSVMITADGCVQTSGEGKTWKKYVNPSGNNSGPNQANGLYYGTLKIKGATTINGPLPEGTPLYYLTAPITAPAQIFIPPIQSYPGSSNIFLTLGYVDEDDRYNDEGGNGYWGHDDGNDDQCANTDPNAPLGSYGGPAWVNLRIVHDSSNPFGNIVPQTWDIVPNGIEVNGLALNPEWGWQVTGGTINNQGVYDDSCANACTSQFTQRDLPTTSPLNILNRLVGVCRGDFPESLISGYRGHRNWFDATYTGSIYWDEHETPTFGDDDYNMRLETPVFHADPAGTSFYNSRSVDDGKDFAILLEFDSDETIDHFDQSRFWRNFHDIVDHESDAVVGELVNGHDAVVIGLMGMDEQHKGHVEIHPVHALAIREGAPRSPNPSNDTWAFFVRNWGDEGECSSQQHYLLSNEITFQLTPPGNLQGARAVLNGNTQVFGTGTTGTFDFYSGPEGTFVRFNFTPGSRQPFAFGEIGLSWTGGTFGESGAVFGPATISKSLPPARSPKADDNDDPEEQLRALWNSLSPTEQQQYKDILNNLNPPRPPIVSARLQPAIVPNPPQRPSAMPGVAQEPALAKLQRDVDQFQVLCAATNGNVPDQPDLCPAANPPPVTTLKTTGGKPGQNDWLVTTVVVTLTAYDTTGAGIDHIEYSLDGQSWRGYTTPLTMPEGQTKLYYRSLNKKGVTEDTRQRLFKVDTAPPRVTGLPPTPFCTLWPPDSRIITVTESATDAVPGSGVDATSFTLDVVSNEPNSGPGPDIVVNGRTAQVRVARSVNGTGRVYTFTGSVRDIAGNAETWITNCLIPVR